MGIKLLVIVASYFLGAAAFSDQSLYPPKPTIQEIDNMRVEHLNELGKLSNSALRSRIMSYKFGTFGVVALCQKNYKKLFELAESKNLEDAERVEMELPLLDEEVDTRCANAYYRYADLVSMIRARQKNGWSEARQPASERRNKKKSKSKPT